MALERQFYCPTNSALWPICRAHPGSSQVCLPFVVTFISDSSPLQMEWPFQAEGITNSSIFPSLVPRNLLLCESPRPTNSQSQLYK